MEKPKKNYNKIKPKPLELKDFLDIPYTLDHSENYEAFLQELGIRKDTRIKAINSKPTIVLSQSNNIYILSTSYPEGRHIKIKFKLDEECKRRPSGRYVSSVFRVTNNKLFEEQTFEDKKILIEREFRKKDLLVTMGVNDVQCQRIYTEAKSKYSVGTETSRQFSIWEKESQNEIGGEEIEASGETTLESHGETDEEKLCY